MAEKETIKIKGIKNERKLGNFYKACPSIFAASDTKKLVKPAADGNLEEYKKAVLAYKWRLTRDYNMVLVIFSPIVVAAQAAIKYGRENGNELDEEHTTLLELVEATLNNEYFRKLCEFIGKGDGASIKSTLEKNLPSYKELLQKLSGNKYGKTGDDFMKRAGQITKWIVNGKYIENKLIPFVKDVLDAKFATGLTKWKAQIETDDVTPENTIVEDLEKVFDECLKGAASKFEDDSMIDFLAGYDTKGKALYTNNINKTYPGYTVVTVAGKKNVIFVAKGKEDLRMFFNPATYEKINKSDLYEEGAECITKYFLGDEIDHESKKSMFTEDTAHTIGKVPIKTDDVKPENTNADIPKAHSMEQIKQAMAKCVSSYAEEQKTKAASKKKTAELYRTIISQLPKEKRTPDEIVKKLFERYKAAQDQGKKECLNMADVLVNTVYKDLSAADILAFLVPYPDFVRKVTIKR